MMPDHATAIKQEGGRLGFAAVGIARAETLDEEGRRLQQWLSRGFHGSMAWMEQAPERRIDPRQVLQGARTVISVAVNYYTPEPHPAARGAAKISRYAWGDDYHAILEERIRKFEDFIRSREPGVRTRGYVDTGPVMDKAWAARTGLGWIGKHTNLITRSHGSWVFLGTILTTLDCRSDEPVADMCGTCTACLDACPTQAFPEAYVLDARRCISYLTIEHRGEVDAELRHRYDGWIYGCDVCQDVCPWNRFSQLSAEEAFRPRPGLVEPDLEELSGLSQEEFSRRFSGSAIKRAKSDGLKRTIRYVRESSAQ